MIAGFDRIILLRGFLLLIWWCCTVTSVEAFSRAGLKPRSRHVLHAATLPIPSSTPSYRYSSQVANFGVPSNITVQKEIDKFEKDIESVLKKLRPSETDPSIKGA
jgi:hypothetical protein